MLNRALPNWVQVLVAGVYSSGISPMHVKQVVEPPTTSTRPSERVVAVGYQRGKAMEASEVQVFVTGLKRLTSGMPTPPAECPPAISTLPSVMSAGAEQKMLSTLGT